MQSKLWTSMMRCRIEITSNRVDCFSMIGIAREAAATFKKDFFLQLSQRLEMMKMLHDYIKVTVEDPELCPRYTARVVKNIKLAPSPEWMQRRLASMGIRPINNLVDITNYVMEEYGQPMHAYDLDTIAGQRDRCTPCKRGRNSLHLMVRKEQWMKCINDL